MTVAPISLTRHRVSLVCLVALLFALPVATAQAAPTGLQQASDQTSQAQAGVDSAQSALSAANASLAAAQAQSAQAQSALAAAQAQWQAAQQASNDAAIALSQANQAVTVAQAKVDDAQAKITAQQAAINAYARSIVQDSLPLVGIAALLSATSPTELADRLQWNDTVLAANQVDLDQLRHLQADFQAALAEAEAAQARADQAKQAADAEVATAREAQQAAAQAATDLANALARQQAAQQAAVTALRDSQTRLSQAQANQAAIEAQIAAAQRQAEAEAQAAALAAAAADQAQAAADQAAREAAAQPPAAAPAAPPPAASGHASAIAQTATRLAWPYGQGVTDGDGTPATPAYRQALDQFQSKTCVRSWLPDGRVCALFVAVVVWSSGVDPNFGGGGNVCLVSTLTNYMSAHPAMYQKLTYSGNANLRPGDLIVPTDFSHIAVYLGNGRQADASLSYARPGYGGRTGAIKSFWPWTGYVYRYIG